MSFQYACRKSIAFDSCSFEVYWNNEEIFATAGQDYFVHTENFTVVADEGENSISFVEVGVEDGAGMTVDNVALYAADTGGWEVTNSSGNGTQECECPSGTYYDGSSWNCQKCSQFA